MSAYFWSSKTRVDSVGREGVVESSVCVEGGIEDGRDYVLAFESVM
jgi:hypothetical protein